MSLLLLVLTLVGLYLYELTLLFLACMLGGNGLSVLTLIGLDCACELTLEMFYPAKIEAPS